MINKNRSIAVIMSCLMMSTGSLLVQPVSAGEIYKCTNGQGKIFYKDKPCATTEKEKKVKIAVIPKSSLGNNHGLSRLNKPTAKQMSEKAKRDFKRNENERLDRQNDIMNQQLTMGKPQPDRK